MTTIRRSHTQGKFQRVAHRPPSLHTRVRCGSLLLEAIIAIGVFSLFLAGIGLSLILGERSTIAGGDRTRAAFIAEQQLEAVRQMRNADYDSVTTGTHGTALGPSGWTWSGAVRMIDGYTASVTVAEAGTDWLEVTADVGWNFGKTRSGSLSLHTYITDWRKTATVGNWADISRIALLSASGSPDYQKIAIAGTYAFVTGTKVSGGRGLYVFDISNPASPVAVATSFDLGSSAYGVAAYADRLYLATDSATQELQVYDISSPAELNTGNLVNSYDLPDSGQARTVAVYGSNVFVGTLETAGNPQLYAVEMSETGPMVLLGTLGMSGSVMDLGLQDGYAYAATANNAGELLVADIFDPENITFAPGNGIDMTDTQDAVSVALSGTSALIGRSNGSTIDELTLYDIGQSPVPSPPPGPWTLEIGGTVNDLATVYGGRYAFAGTSQSASQIRVLDLIRFAQGQTPTVDTYDTSAAVRGLAYDWVTDRLFAVTASSFSVYAPGP